VPNRDAAGARAPRPDGARGRRTNAPAHALS
jgi:hypothetical protein